MGEQKNESHVLLVPYPAQGHINPMLQFAKRLAASSVRASVAITRFIASTAQPAAPVPNIAIEHFSDGFDGEGFNIASDVTEYLARLESVGSDTLAALIESLRSRGSPVQVLVYDAFLPWAYNVGSRFGLRTAAFFTQACAVDALYWQAWAGRLKLPVTGPVALAPGLPRLHPRDLPSFLTDQEPAPYPGFTALLQSQFKNLDKADAVLVNSFYELEQEEFNWMRSTWPMKSIGPTLPSTYLDNRIPSDSHYGLNMYTFDSQPYRSWLTSKPHASVIYVSFGSYVSPSMDQTRELLSALANTKYSFVWVVRESEMAKLPETFVQDTAGRGLVLIWCNQLDVLAHDAVGCFLTHCGWNSTIEGISLGVPMVAMPLWTDQPTNAKYIEDVWRVGVRVKAEDGSGIVRSSELERCFTDVMEGKKREEVRRNASKWKELAKRALGVDGSSDKNIGEFISKFCMW